MSRTERRPAQRYTRSSTTSVTQLLSDSCSSLLAKLTTRSREEPSTRQRIEDRYERRRIEEVTRPRIKADEKTRLLDDATLGITRSRLEDKYSDVLEKYVRRKNELRKAESPIQEPKRGLAKSATAGSVLLSEKAYPFVATQIGAQRDKTPFRAGDAVVRPARQKSHKDAETQSQPHAARRRRSRAELSEKPSLKLCPIEIEPDMPAMSTRRLKGLDSPPPSLSMHKDARESLRMMKELSAYRLPSNRKAKDEKGGDPNAVWSTSPVDPVIKEREARRKEIQSLINKYVMLDEAYGKVGKSVTREKTLKAAATQTTAVAVPNVSHSSRLALTQPVARKVCSPPAVSNTPSCARVSITVTA